MSRSSSASYYGWVVLISCLWLLYVASPIDLLPDVFPGIGWVDDLLALAGVYWFIRRLQTHVSKNTSGDDRKENFYDEADTASPENPWHVLQVEPDASPEQIRAAYTQLMLKYHPDRVAHLGEEFQRMAHRKTLAITHAYNLLKQK